jgi:hypothetical protein
MGMTDNQKSITYLPLDRIRVSPANPNAHSDTKIKTLANNIARFGILNPISVIEQEPGLYEIVAGECRFLAYFDLDKRDPTSGKWGRIPAIILEDSDEFSTWGRRLSENRLRSSNWIAECISLDGMRTEIPKSELAELFGLSIRRIEKMIEIGRIPTIRDLSGRPRAAQVEAQEVRSPDPSSDALSEPVISLKHAIDHLLPLRVQVDRQANTPIWDYTQVNECIRRLTTGELKSDELPLYSADCREAIGKAKAKAEKQIDPQTTEQLRKLNTKINNMAAYNETLKRSNDDLQADRESLKKTVAGLNNRLKEVETARTASLNEEIQRSVEEKLQQERDVILNQAKVQAQQEFQENWTDLVKEKRAFEEYEQAIHTKERELKEWEKLIDHSKRSMDRDARQRMLDAIDGLVDAVTSLRKNWGLLSQPVFEDWIDHMKAAQIMYQKLYDKCNTGNTGRTGNDDKTKEIQE